MKKYDELINKAKNIMVNIEDPEHNFEHIKDVIIMYERIIEKIKDKYNYNKDICYISIIWHDVGRSVEAEGHEKISAEMLKNELIKNEFDNEFIDNCYKAIIHHKWSMTPETIEGKIIRDADKLAWIGINRWKECLKKGYEMNSIIELLPKLRNEVLYFEESKDVYDEVIVEFSKFLYEYKK